MVETLKNVGSSIIQADGSLSKEALHLRLSEQYVQTMYLIFKNANAIVLPEETHARMQSGQPLDSDFIRSAFAQFKSLLGPNDSAVPASPEEFQAAMKNVNASQLI